MKQNSSFVGENRGFIIKDVKKKKYGLGSLKKSISRRRENMG